MKLISKYTIAFLCTSCVFFAIFSTLFFRFTESILNNQANDELMKQKAEVLNFVRNIDSLRLNYMNMDEKLKFDICPTVIRTLIVDTMMKLSHDSMPAPYRLLKFTYKKNDKRYRITIAREMSYVHKVQTDLIQFEIIGLLALFVILSLLNMMVSRKLLRPLILFCDDLQHFNLQSEYKFHGMNSTTTEFKILEASFRSLLETVHKDFENLRLFTENASHEMQTPLTVIQNSIELMIQKEGYTDSQIRLIQNIARNANLLNKIHNDLLLISKLEANYYDYDTEINYAQVLKNVLHNYSILSENKNLTIQADIIETCIQRSNLFVASLLFNNLVMNAIKYALPGSEIRIILKADFFSIENLSDALPQEVADKLFERFFKGNHNSEGTGLGLAMVKQICLNLQYTLHYFQSDGVHHFQIKW